MRRASLAAMLTLLAALAATVVLAGCGGKSSTNTGTSTSTTSKHKTHPGY